MKLTEAEQKRLAWFIAERQSDQGMPLTTLPEFIDLLLVERKAGKAVIDAAKAFHCTGRRFAGILLGKQEGDISKAEGVYEDARIAFKITMDAYEKAEAAGGSDE